MINELYALSLSLEKNGIDIPVKHPWVAGVKKGEALLVNMNKQAQVASVEFCSPDRVATFWNISESNKQTFPKINIDPLWGKLVDKDLLEEIVAVGKEQNWQTWFQLTRKLFSEYPEIVCRKKSEQIKAWKKDKWTRLYRFPQEYILPHINMGNEGLRELIHCFDSWKDFSEKDVNNLLVQIARKLIDDLEHGKLECFKLAQDILIGRPGAKQQSTVTVIFNCSEQKVVVADRHEERELCSALSGQGAYEKNYKCPLTGKLTTQSVSKFPNPTLPVIGNTFLMAMNEAASCHNRYGKIGASIFPASSTATSVLDNVLRYITSKERSNKTWMSVASGKWDGNPKKERRDLLIVYAEDIAALQNENLALLMGGDSGNEQEFESISSIVCDALRKNRATETSSKLRLFVIQQIDPGRRQVVLDDFCTYSQLYEAVQVWNKAAGNHPPLSISLPLKKGEKSVWHQPVAPFPADVTRLLQYQWIREGTESHKFNSCPLVMAYDLFFDRGARTKSTARQVLKMLLQRVTPLLAGFGKAQHLNNYELLNDYSIFAKKTVLQAFSIIGIILFKLGHHKEVYMKDAGYNIGRMLSLTDCLHKEYCKYVRKDDIPNQLLGNTFLRTVLDSPVRGLARLSERIAVYKAWIDRSHGEEFKLAHWAQNEMGKISERLSELTLPNSTDDEMKAQILLGYLAHTESKN